MATETETILIVDDEESVRKTFLGWLDGANLGCRVLSAADAESALLLANQHTVDLAILDWNLGAGDDGLRLLEDLTLFNPEVVAIMITGFAHQATPLDAMRMGVRDYLDKNQDLNRASFLTAVRRQLERIRPARRERRLHHELVAFRAAVEKILPLVQAAVALQDPVPLPAAVAHLFRFLMRTTGARDGVLLVRSYDADREPVEICRAYDTEGKQLNVELAPFAHSLAGSVASMDRPCVLVDLERNAAGVQLHPFERGRRSLLAAPLRVAPGLQVVLELFDKTQSPPGEAAGAGFSEADRQMASTVADFGAEMLRQALAERQTQRMLFDAVAAALWASETVTKSLRPDQGRPEDPPPQEVMEQLRDGLSGAGSAVNAEDTIRLAEAVRELAVRHGSAAVNHCIQMVESLRALLDEATGSPPDAQQAGGAAAREVRP
jgi:two-component system, NtrC family, nitrogen regulation response regulator NtrX